MCECVSVCIHVCYSMINFVSWDSNEVIIVNVCVICKTFNPVAFGNNQAQKLTIRQC